MCRLFLQVSAGPKGAVDLLADSDFSLLKQSSGKRSCPQKDGWGVGWHDEKGNPRRVRSPYPIYKEEKKLRAAAERAVSRVVVGHIRAASNPLGLTNKALITEVNAQPFMLGRWLFAHNGTLLIPRETRAALGPLAKKLTARNDSEIYFYHLLKHMKKAGSFHDAVQAALLELWDIWDSCRKRHPGKQAPYTSMNAVLSDGRRGYAICHAASAGMASTGVFHPSQPWSQMSFSQRGSRLLAASEGLDRKDWTLMLPPETIEARAAGGVVKAIRRTLHGLPQMHLKSNLKKGACP